jgi:hypothetical protein
MWFSTLEGFRENEAGWVDLGFKAGERSTGVLGGRDLRSGKNRLPGHTWHTCPVTLNLLTLGGGHYGCHFGDEETVSLRG